MRIDTHVHLGAQAGMNIPRLLMTPRSLQLLYAVPNCAATLAAGITTIRDAGLTPAGVKLAVERALFPGPRMQVAVSILGQTGGHRDEPFVDGDGQLAAGLMEQQRPEGGRQHGGGQPEDQTQPDSQGPGVRHRAAPPAR